MNDRSEAQALVAEALELSKILSGMVEGGYSDLETLYTSDQADGDAFVKRAAEVLVALAQTQAPAPTPQQQALNELCAESQRLGLYAPAPSQEPAAQSGGEVAAEKFIRAAIANSPQPLKDLGEHLAQWLDEDRWATAERLLLQLATPPSPQEPTVSQAVPEGWLPMTNAPTDGTCVRLLIEGGEHPMQDETPSISIGSYGVEGGPEEDPTWHFVGWSWHQDCYCRGTGEPVGWLPLGPIVAQVIDKVDAELPLMHAAFRTEVSDGTAGRYEMVFRFPTLRALLDAGDEWVRHA